MSNRGIWRALWVSTCLVAGLVVSAPVSSAGPAGAARLAAAGLDAGTLKPGWTLVGDEIWWDGGDVRHPLSITSECPSG